MKKSTSLTDEERALFRESMQKVTPLKQTEATKKPVSLTQTATYARKRISIRQPEPDIERLQIDDHTPILQPEQSLYFHQPGVQHRTMQLMRRGQISIDAELDLHGKNLDEAEQALSHFLSRAFEHQWRCVLVIHGKGAHSQASAPVLKNRVNQWLRAHPQVLAFCSATPFQGGVGAVYVLLKRERY